MYGQGSGIPVVLGATTGLGTVAMLPVTGMHSAIVYAVAAVAGLSVWGIVYALRSKLRKH